MPRRFCILALSLWPGLAQIWTGQELLGLLVGIAFGLVSTAAVLTKGLWHQALPDGGPAFLGALAASIWLCTTAYTAWWLWRCHPGRHQVNIDQEFRAALEAGLRGEWETARRSLERLLALNESDADAWMHLGTAQLHLGDLESARRAFRQCLDLEQGSKWRWEIEDALRRADPASALRAPTPHHRTRLPVEDKPEIRIDRAFDAHFREDED